MPLAMPKASRSKPDGESWYAKKCREDPNFKKQRAETVRLARTASKQTPAEDAAAAASAPAPAATTEAETATSPGFFARTMPSVFGGGASTAAQQQQPAGSGAPVSGGYATAAALDGLRYPAGPPPNDIGYHGNEWAHLKRAHQLLGVQLLEPGLLREEQLKRAAERLARGEAAFTVGEWAESSAAFLVYGDFDPLPDDEESLWGRRVIDDKFRFVGIHELAGVAGASGMPSLMCGAGSLLQQVLPRAYATYADETASRVDGETEVHEALETAVEALGHYINSAKESKPQLARNEPLPTLIEKLTAAQARVNALVEATVREARAVAPPAAAPPAAAPAPAAAAPAAPARSARSPSRGHSPAAPTASPTASGSRSTRNSPSFAPAMSEKARRKQPAHD